MSDSMQYNPERMKAHPPGTENHPRISIWYLAQTTPIPHRITGENGREGTHWAPFQMGRWRNKVNRQRSAQHQEKVNKWRGMAFEDDLTAVLTLTALSAECLGVCPGASGEPQNVAFSHLVFHPTMSRADMQRHVRHLCDTNDIEGMREWVRNMDEDYTSRAVAGMPASWRATIRVEKRKPWATHEARKGDAPDSAPPMQSAAVSAPAAPKPKPPSPKPPSRVKRGLKSIFGGAG